MRVSVWTFLLETHLETNEDSNLGGISLRALYSKYSKNKKKGKETTMFFLVFMIQIDGDYQLSIISELLIPF